MIRGGLLNEIQRVGKKNLRKLSVHETTPSSTLARAGFLHELRSKRPAVPAAAESASRRGSTKPMSATSVSSMSLSASAAASSGSSVSLREGWLHKRSNNSIWQRRYFMLTPSALQYSSHAPNSAGVWNDAHVRESMPMIEVHDPHPTGQGGEFAVFHKERRLRLRAPNAAEAGAWVSALIAAGLELHKAGLISAPSASSVVRGMLCPRVHVTACDQTSGEPLRLEYLPDALAEAAAQLGEPPSVREALFAGALQAVESDDEPEIPLPAMLREWRVPESQVHLLLRWTHPKVLLPALELLRERVDMDRLCGVQVQPDGWVALIDFDASYTPPRASIHHYLWHVASAAKPIEGATPVAPSLVGGGMSSGTVRFLVELSLVFSPGSVEDIGSSNVKIIDFDFDEGGADRAARDETRSVLKPLCLPHLDYVQIWRRPLHRLPVHKDVPRLLKGMLVSVTDGTELYRDDGTARPAEPATQIAALRRLMLALARKLDGPQVVRCIEEKMPDFLSADTGDVAGGFRHFLLESGLPETSLFVQIFKAIHQEMIFPAVYALRTSLHAQLPYKDIKGEWRVRVDISPHDVRVSHLKWEQTQDYDATAFFKFRWGLVLTFDRRMLSLDNASLHVLDCACPSPNCGCLPTVIMSVFMPPADIRLPRSCACERRCLRGCDND